MNDLRYLRKVRTQQDILCAKTLPRKATGLSRKGAELPRKAVEVHLRKACFVAVNITYYVVFHLGS